MGSKDIYGAASNWGPWANTPVIAGDGNQSQPAVAVGSVGRVLHVVWTDDAAGDWDIFYVMLDGLPDSSVLGEDIVDDVSDADQNSPAIAARARPDGSDRVVAWWQDGRDGLAGPYGVDLSLGAIRTNVFIEGQDPAAADAAMLQYVSGVGTESGQ
jgi:hypothetical protein